MVNLLHARVVFEHLNIEHAIVALSHCRNVANCTSCRHVAVSPAKFAFVILSSVICHPNVLKISTAYRVTSAA